MMKINWKVLLGLVISVFFMFLALRSVSLTELSEAFREANYWYILPAIAILLFSHWLRAVRWQYFILPLKKIKTPSLFSATMIGYMGNAILPAHLGEFFRAFVVSKKKEVSMSAIFATIVIERLIDLWSLLIVMAITFIVYPFPDWVTKSGYLTFAFAGGLFFVLIFVKNNMDFTLKITTKILGFFPQSLSTKIQNLLTSFFEGLVPLKHWSHYIIVTLYSLVIWTCYASIFYLTFYAFQFADTYNLTWIASLVLLVVTTISVIVPSSPGYVGTYHWLCQLSLGFFGVAKSTALTYAFLVHAVFFLPPLVVGLVYVWVEGFTISNMYKRAKLPPTASEPAV